MCDFQVNHRTDHGIGFSLLDGAALKSSLRFVEVIFCLFVNLLVVPEDSLQFY